MAPERTERLTDEQRAAIETRDVSIALSAGAGCGKTYVLTRRFLSHLEPDDSGEDVSARLHRLVAITFTERAAREMRGRVREVCRRRANRDDPQAGHWLALLRSLDAARISTIHSFCGSLLRAHAVEAGLDPHFVTLDESQSATILSELTDDLLRTWLAAEDADTIDLAQRYGIGVLKQRIETLLDGRASIDWQTWTDVSADEVVARWQRFRDEELPPLVSRRVAASHEAQQVLATLADHQPTGGAMVARCAAVVELLNSLPGCSKSAATLNELHRNSRVQGGGGESCWDSAEVYAQVRDQLAALRYVVKEHLWALDWQLESARPAAEVGLRMLRVADRVRQKYDAHKRELAALDFEDLILSARNLLVGNPQLTGRLAEQLDLLLVDEFQDTDPVQTELVRLLCGDALQRGKLFFVGDHKQSIYRFRGADPRVFRELSGQIPDNGQLRLGLNFRSQPAILEFVNHLFCRRLSVGHAAQPRTSVGRAFQPAPQDASPALADGLESPSYGNYEPLRAERNQVSSRPAIEFLWATSGNPPDGPQEPVSVQRQREAHWIARRLKGWLDSGERMIADQDGQLRELRPGDVAILFRTLNDVEYYESALRDYGIDYYLVGGHAFYSQQEVFDLLNLLRSLARVSDEVSLAGVLRSPLFGLADESLLWLKAAAGGLGRAILERTVPAELDAEQARRVRFAADVLATLRDLKDRLPIAALIQQALDLTGYDATLVSEFLGERKLANLRKLIATARSFDQSGILSLEDYITQLSEFVARMPKEALAATQPEESNVVRLMTIHQAKGLEFPLVVLPDLNRKQSTVGASVAFDPQLGPVIRLNDEAQRFAPSPGRDMYRLAEQEQDDAESVRLLYVATTRAKDYLLLSAGVDQVGQAESGWMRLLAERFDLETGALRDFAPGPTGDAPPQARVTIDDPAADAPPRRQRGAELLKIVEQVRAATRGKVPKLAAAVAPDLAARRQYSVSRLKGSLEVDIPRVTSEDGQESTGDATELGTLVHGVLEVIDFAQPGDVASHVQRVANELRHPGEETPDLKLAAELVERFLPSDRAAALARSAEVYRELEFLLTWPPGTEPGAEGITLRGYIDCLYRDAADGWQLVDYKTNRTTAETLAQTAAEYEMQMLLYALVIERLFGTSPAGIVLCFLRPGLEYKYSWNDEARERAIALIDDSLAIAVG